MLFVKIATAAAAAAALVCVTLFVMTDLFAAALAACLCGWLMRSVRHGTADDDGHGDVATRLRVFGGMCSAALADVRLGVRSWCVCV